MKATSRVSLLVLAGLFVCAASAIGAEGTTKKAEARKQIRDSIARGAAFLREAQRDDGGWGGRGSDVGITGLVVEALAKAPADMRAKNADAIEKGVEYILSNRRENGSIVNEDGSVANYRTSIATRALIAVDAQKHKDVIAAAVKYTKGIQGTDPDDELKYGSIGYGSDESKGDIINLSEALEMLAQAGVKEGDEVYERAITFLGRTQNLDEYADPGVVTTNDGGGIYRADHSVDGASKAGTIVLPDGTRVPRSYGGATYSLLKSLLFAGMDKDSPRVRAAYKWICDHYTVEEHPEMGKQGLFYFYYTMARTLELWGSPAIKKGEAEHAWPVELGEQVVSLQKDDGSWVNSEDRWWESDPALVTAYTISTLNICGRMLEE